MKKENKNQGDHPKPKKRQRRPITEPELKELLDAQGSTEHVPDARRIKKAAQKFYSAADLYGGI